MAADLVKILGSDRQNRPLAAQWLVEKKTLPTESWPDRCETGTRRQKCVLCSDWLSRNLHFSLFDYLVVLTTFDEPASKWRGATPIPLFSLFLFLQTVGVKGQWMQKLSWAEIWLITKWPGGVPKTAPRLFHWWPNFLQNGHKSAKLPWHLLLLWGWEFLDRGKQLGMGIRTTTTSQKRADRISWLVCFLPFLALFGRFVLYLVIGAYLYI